MSDPVTASASRPQDGASEKQSRAHPLRGPSRPEFLTDLVLSEIFGRTAEEHPERRAIVTEGRTLTYGDLDRASDEIARGLMRRGIGAGDVVGLWFPRGADLLIAQIGITKTGAAWLPFDADAPPARIATCLADASAKAIIASGPLAERLEGCPCPAVTEGDLVDENDTTPVPRRAPGLTGEQPAYLIYTSGSTGTPKGITVLQRNVTHYLRAANTVYGIHAQDVVFQGASVAFDLSVEEIWIPYMVGATLWVATPHVMNETDQLARVLSEAGVTVIDTVPTLLSLIGDVPSLRVIILGGEACPPALIDRWWRPNRKIFNSYGPTEITIVATVDEAVPGAPVTIGRPIPNYSAYVVNPETLQEAPAGSEGELLVGGPGVTAGYLGRAALTAEKFIANPFASDGTDPVLYRTGDAVSVDDDGKIRFHGRIDDQVKIRGLRVELGEIESALAEHPGIRQAAVVMRQDGGIDRLVAFVVTEPGVVLEQVSLRAALRERMPPYMVPNLFEPVDTLPQLASGKVDRNKLKALPIAPPVSTDEQEAPDNEIEALLLAAAQPLFPGQAIPFDGDFFTELGGHSLLAARFVSAVRINPALAGLNLQDVYRERTLRRMASYLKARSQAETGRPMPAEAFEPPPLMRRFLCGLAQAAVLPFVLALATFQWLGVFGSYLLFSSPEASLTQEFAMLIGMYILINIASFFLVIGLKWLIIGRTKPGAYPLWGVYYFRWWLVMRLQLLVHKRWFQASPVMRFYLRAMGARIGRDVIISELDVGAIDLLSIGDRSSVGDKVCIANARVIGNTLYIGPVELGADTYVGTTCVIEENCVLGEGAELADVTSIPAGTRIGAWEKWDGSPGRKVGMVDAAALPEQAQTTPLNRFLQNCVYVLALIVIPPIGLAPIIPAFHIFDHVDAFVGQYVNVSYLTYLPLLAWPAAMVLILGTVFLIAAVRWAVLPRVKPGVYSIHSWFYVRKWIVALATEVTLDVLTSLYATVYMRAWYRLMGAKIGKGSEISSNLSGRYDLIEIGDKCFMADEAVLGEEDIRRGWMRLEPMKTGSRVFVGNNAVVHPGASLPSDCLIGVKSKLPDQQVKSGETWFGSPPILMPNRQKFEGFEAIWTFEPSWKRKLGRAVFEAFAVSLPSMLFICTGTLAIETIAPATLEGDWGTAALILLAIAVAVPFAMLAIVVAVKWALMGKYVPTIKPMWSWWAMKTEAVAVLYWGLAGKVLLEPIRGTPFLPWALRLFGTKVGKGCWLDMTDITEFDVVKIGDFVVLNSMSCLQTHLYEDRLMKVGRITVGNGVTVGFDSTVLYDTVLGDHAQIGSLTLVMKGETIPPLSAWAGSPAQPAMLPAEDAPAKAELQAAAE